MGWTALCRDYFNNCRADALDAAYRALVEEDPNRPLPANVIHAFVSVKVVAEELYSSTLTRNALVSDLDVVAKDVLDQGNTFAKKKIQELKGTTEILKTSNMNSQNKTPVAQNCYPSPDRSPCSLPLPVFDGPRPRLYESGSGEDSSLRTVTGCKRRLSSSAAHTSASESPTRPVKRSRPSSSSVNVSLPSPATSVEELLGNDQMTSSDPTTQGLANPSKTRKRRLSCTNYDKLPERPRDSAVESCLHIVSDSLPLTPPENDRPVDEWFKANFDTLFVLPPPADVAQPDISAQWEVELFKDYSIPEHSPNNLPYFTQENRTLSSVDLTTLDDLFRSLESDVSVVSPEITQPPIVTSVCDPVSLDQSLLQDLSQPIDWATLLNEDPSEFTSDTLFPQCYVDSALPEIDLSMLQLPQVWTQVAS